MDEVSRQTLQKIVLKDVNALTENDREFLRARESYLVPSEKEKFASVLHPVKPKETKKVVKKPTRRKK